MNLRQSRLWQPQLTKTGFILDILFQSISTFIATMLYIQYNYLKSTTVLQNYKISITEFTEYCFGILLGILIFITKYLAHFLE